MSIGLHRTRSLVGSVSAALFAGVLLSACGGGGGGTDAPSGSGGGTALPPVAEDGTARVPAAASGSVSAMMAWAKSLVSSDTAEPLGTRGLNAPLDETTETSPG